MRSALKICMIILVCDPILLWTNWHLKKDHTHGISDRQWNHFDSRDKLLILCSDHLLLVGISFWLPRRSSAKRSPWGTQNWPRLRYIRLTCIRHGDASECGPRGLNHFDAVYTLVRVELPLSFRRSRRINYHCAKSKKTYGSKILVRGQAFASIKFGKFLGTYWICFRDSFTSWGCDNNGVFHYNQKDGFLRSPPLLEKNLWIRSM